MALLNILQFPDKRLNLVASPVVEVNDELRSIVKDMFETMYEAQGIGLAAIQVNIQKRIVVMDLSDNKGLPIVMLNPEIVQKTGDIVFEEGCLSFPGIYAKVKRAKQVAVEFLDLDFNKQTLEADEVLAICVQHEIDHLDGITFYDHLSHLKQRMVRKKIEKLRGKVL